MTNARWASQCHAQRVHLSPPATRIGDLCADLCGTLCTRREESEHPSSLLPLLAQSSSSGLIPLVHSERNRHIPKGPRLSCQFIGKSNRVGNLYRVSHLEITPKLLDLPQFILNPFTSVVHELRINWRPRQNAESIHAYKSNQFIPGSISMRPDCDARQKCIYITPSRPFSSFGRCQMQRNFRCNKRSKCGSPASQCGNGLPVRSTAITPLKTWNQNCGSDHGVIPPWIGRHSAMRPRARAARPQGVKDAP